MNPVKRKASVVWALYIYKVCSDFLQVYGTLNFLFNQY